VRAFGVGAGRGRVQEFVLFMISSALFQASRLGVNLVAASLLAPAMFGLWGLFVVSQTYTTYGSLGLISGANRRIPLLLGSGSAAQVAEVERTVLAGSVGAGAILALGGAVVGLALGGPWQTAGILLGLGAFTQQLYLFGQVVLRGHLEFNRASSQQFILAVAFPFLGLPALIWWGVNGLIAAQAAAYLLGFGLAWRWRPELRPAWSGRLGVSIIREGAPIMLAGLAFAGMTSVDRWVVLAFAGQAALGHYALASTISSSMLFVNLVIAQQFYPRMAHQFGAGRDGAHLLKVAREQSLAAGLLILPMALGVLILAPLVIPRVYPQYTPTVGVTQVLGLAAFVLALASGYTNLLVTVGHAWQLFVLQIVAGVIGAILGVLALQAGWGLPGVGIAMLVAFGWLGLAAWFMARRGVVRMTADPSRLIIEQARPALGGVLLLCSTDVHAAMFAPVARELRGLGWQGTLVSLDPYYAQGATAAARKLWADVRELVAPPGVGTQPFYGRSVARIWRDVRSARGPVRRLLSELKPRVVVVGNDRGLIEKLVLEEARARGALTVLVQDGHLGSRPTPELELRRRIWRRSRGLLSWFVRRLGGMTFAATTYGTWGCDRVCASGEEGAEALRARGVPANRIVVTGQPRYDAVAGPESGAGRGVVCFTTPFAAQNLGTEAQGAQSRLLAEIARTLHSSEVPFTVKPHPRERSADYESIPWLTTRPVDESPAATVRGAELVLVGISTVVEEAVLARVPVAVLGERVHGSSFDGLLPDASIFPRVESGEDVLGLVMGLRNGSIDREDLLKREGTAFLRRVSQDPTRSAASRVAMVVNELSR
jgi:O-antigen/teichoic acid export membrane protein